MSERAHDAGKKMAQDDSINYRGIGLSNALDYAFSKTEAESLLAVVTNDIDIRMKLLRAMAKDDPEHLADLFACFIGLANSVVANNRECIELFGLCEGTLNPHHAHQINLPTIFGALHGCILFERAPKQISTCNGCAYRLGSPANQSPVTTLDAIGCYQDNEPFLCHEVEGTPTELCRGHAQACRAPHA